MSREFTVTHDPGRGAFCWLVVWSECDGRISAACCREYEVRAICKLLNESGTAEKWYRRARAANALKAAEGKL